VADRVTMTRTVGRTTRLITEAKRLVSEGQRVYIVVATSEQRRFIGEQLGPVALYGQLLQVITTQHVGFQWSPEPRVLGDNAAVVLIDHFAVESEIAALEARIARLRPLALRWG